MIDNAVRFLTRMQKFNRIKVVLDERGIRYSWLAEKIDVKPATITRYCSNDIQPRMDRLFAIAEVLDIDVCDLLISNKRKQDTEEQ